MLIESDSLKPPLLQLHCFLRLLPQSRIERPYKTGSLQGTEPFFFLRSWSMKTWQIFLKMASAPLEKKNQSQIPIEELSPIKLVPLQVIFSQFF